MPVTNNSGSFQDLKKFKVWIDDTDITAMVYSAHVFQEIFSPTTTAIFNLDDMTNLITSMPIQAGRKIKLSIETENGSAGDGEQTWEFSIYKIDDKVSHQQNRLNYSLYAADDAFLINQTKRLYRGYSNQKASDIISSIVSESFDGKVSSHVSDKAINIIIPGWTPFYAISKLLEISISKGAADYVFFQNWDKSFSFKSFEKLYSDKSESSGITFTSRPGSIRTSDGTFDYDYSLNIGTYNFQHFDALSNIQSGFYSSKTASYDFLTKTWKESQFTYGDDCAADKAVMAVDNSILTQGADVNITFAAKSSKIFDSGSSYSDDADTWVGSRKSSLMKFEQDKIVFQVPGSAGATKWFGKSCIIDLPSQDVLNPEDPIDKRYRGTYLITHMTHMISKSTYYINIEACKKRLETNG